MRTALISYEESFSLPENQYEEIVRGEPRVMPPASRSHDRLLRRLEAMLSAQLGPDYVVTGPGVGLGITKEPFTYRIPDKMIFTAGMDARMDNPVYIWETPLLIVECLSPANRKGNVDELLTDYLRIRAPEVWLLRPEEHRCEVRRSGGTVSTTPVIEEVLTFASIARIPLPALWDAFERPL